MCVVWLHKCLASLVEDNSTLWWSYPPPKRLQSFKHWADLGSSVVLNYLEIIVLCLSMSTQVFAKQSESLSWYDRAHLFFPFCSSLCSKHLKLVYWNGYLLLESLCLLTLLQFCGHFYHPFAFFLPMARQQSAKFNFLPIPSLNVAPGRTHIQAYGFRGQFLTTYPKWALDIAQKHVHFPCLSIVHLS